MCTNFCIVHLTESHTYIYHALYLLIPEHMRRNVTQQNQQIDSVEINAMLKQILVGQVQPLRFKVMVLILY